MRRSNSNDWLSSSNVVPMQCALPGSSTHGVETSLGEPSGDPGKKNEYQDGALMQENVFTV